MFLAFETDFSTFLFILRNCQKLPYIILWFGGLKYWADNQEVMGSNLTTCNFSELLKIFKDFKKFQKNLIFKKIKKCFLKKYLKSLKSKKIKAIVAFS